VSVDDDLRAARRAVLESPDDELARLRLERLEDRLGLRAHLDPEARRFWNGIRRRWRVNGLPLDFEEGRILLTQFVLPLVSATPRVTPYWSWIRGTQAGWGERPLPFAVRVGDQVAVAIERGRTGPRNLVTPDMVWNELYPWAPGAHEHTRPNGDTPVELVFSWSEGEVVAGVCRHCGEATTPRLAVAQLELHDRIRSWFANAPGKAVASTAAIRYFFDGMRQPSKPETSRSSVADNDGDD
jgi:hypothetical protein